MLKSHYVLGVCINVFVQRKLLEETDNNIEFVIMCNDTIYDNYNELLKYYFDRVIKIDLEKYDMSTEKYKCSESWCAKYKWIMYSTNN